MKPEEKRLMPWLIAGLLAMGVLARFAPHPANATPLLAIALFGGTYLPKRWGILLPLGIVAITDFVLGWHVTIPFTWGAFALAGFLGWWIRANPSATRILGGTLAGAALFYLITNFGVWVVRDFYPRTPAGLWECYVRAIPFFRNALAGDVLYATALFGTYAIATRPRLAHQEAGHSR